MFEQNEMILFFALYFFIGAICFALLVFLAVDQGICAKTEVKQISSILLYTAIGLAWPVAVIVGLFHFLWAVINDYPDYD